MWITEAARRSPGLKVIILLPQAPKEVAFGGERANPAHQHGEYLQARALGNLRDRLGARVGLFALAKKTPMTDAEREFVRDRGAAFGSGMIYVHSKLMIADDRNALVSSANINNRSFARDSEFGVLWHDPDEVAAFRRRLWAQLLEIPEDDQPALRDALAQWHDTAAANIKLPPAERQGFIVPYQFVRPAASAARRGSCRTTWCRSQVQARAPSTTPTELCRSASSTAATIAGASSPASAYCFAGES